MVPRGGVGLDGSDDAGVEIIDQAVELVDVAEMGAGEPGVVLIEPADQRPLEVGVLVVELADGEIGEHGGVALAVDQGVDHQPAGLAERLRRDRAELDRGVFEDLVDSLDFAGAVLSEPLAVAGQGPVDGGSVPVG